MRKAKTEIKIEPYPKGGWYVIERVDGKVWWQSSNYQSIELAEVRLKERKELKANMAKLLDKKLAKRLKPRSGLATNPRVKKRSVIWHGLMNITSSAISNLKTKGKTNSNYLTLEDCLESKQQQSIELFAMDRLSRALARY